MTALLDRFRGEGGVLMLQVRTWYSLLIKLHLASAASVFDMGTGM
jgi:hypothetical protein